MTLTVSILNEKTGGRGLNSIADLYISRTISISYHLKEQAKKNELLQMVLKHESETIVRVADELVKAIEVEVTET